MECTPTTDAVGTTTLEWLFLLLAAWWGQALFDLVRSWREA